jgi:hypothetical protein
MAFHTKKAMGFCTHGFLLMSKQKNARVQASKVIIKTECRFYPVHSYNSTGKYTVCQEKTGGRQL